MNGQIKNGPRNSTGNSNVSTKGKIQVSLLDDTIYAFDLSPRSKGEVLYQMVNTHLNMDEAEYFGLLFEDDEGNPCWLEQVKPIIKQVKDSSKITFKFRVMFYTPDPNSLQEYTRYLFTLQVRRDLLDGRLKCSEDTGALLASYIVQGELGDYDNSTYNDGYLAGFQFVPNQNKDVEEKIVRYHKSHKGEKPADADHNMLEIARQLDMYGITLYPAKDSEGVDLDLAVFHSGILIFQNHVKINTFSWGSIRKISFKRKRFLVKLHQTNKEANNIVSFSLKSRNAAKGFWKICLNHHVFFREKSSEPSKKIKRGGSLRSGSKYRYSGRTKKQIHQDNANKFHGTERDHLRPSIASGSMKVRSSSVSSSVTGNSYPETHSPQLNGRLGSGDEGSSLPESQRVKSFNEEVDTTQIVNTENIQANDTCSFNDDSKESRTPPPNYTDVMNGCSSFKQKEATYEAPQSESTVFSFNKSSEINYESSLNGKENIMNDGDNLSLDATVNVTSSEKEIEDEVASIFGRMSNEKGWQYNISSITPEQLDYSSDTEVTNKDVSISEDTEVDADQKNNNKTIKEFS